MSKPLQKSKTALNATLFTVLTVGALAALNVVSAKHFGRVDLTKDKRTASGLTSQPTTRKPFRTPSIATVPEPMNGSSNV